MVQDCIFLSCARKELKKNKAKIGQTFKTNKQQTTNFSAKNKKSISEPNFTNSEGKIRFGHFLKKMILSTSRKKCHQAKSSIFLRSRSKKQNGDQNRIYPSLTFQTAKLFPLKRVLKNLLILIGSQVTIVQAKKNLVIVILMGRQVTTHDHPQLPFC